MNDLLNYPKISSEIKWTVNQCNKILFNQNGNFTGINTSEQQLAMANVVANYLALICKDKTTYIGKLTELSEIYTHIKDILPEAVQRYEVKKSDPVLQALILHNNFKLQNRQTARTIGNFKNLIQYCNKGDFEKAQMIAKISRGAEYEFANQIITDSTEAVKEARKFQRFDCYGNLETFTPPADSKQSYGQAYTSENYSEFAYSDCPYNYQKSFPVSSYSAPYPDQVFAREDEPRLIKLDFVIGREDVNLNLETLIHNVNEYNAKELIGNTAASFQNYNTNNNPSLKHESDCFILPAGDTLYIDIPKKFLEEALGITPASQHSTKQVEQKVKNWFISNSNLSTSCKETLLDAQLSLGETIFLVRLPEDYLEDHYAFIRESLVNNNRLCADSSFCRMLRAFPEYTSTVSTSKQYFDVMAPGQQEKSLDTEAVKYVVANTTMATGQKSPLGKVNYTGRKLLCTTDFLTLRTLSPSTEQARTQLIKMIQVNDGWICSEMHTAEGKDMRLELLQQSYLYKYSEFLTMARTFPEYDTFIAELSERLQRDAGFRNQVKHVDGFKKDGFLSFALNEATRIAINQQEVAKHKILRISALEEIKTSYSLIQNVQVQADKLVTKLQQKELSPEVAALLQDARAIKQAAQEAQKIVEYAGIKQGLEKFEKSLTELKVESFDITPLLKEIARLQKDMRHDRFKVFNAPLPKEELATINATKSGFSLNSMFDSVNEYIKKFRGFPHEIYDACEMFSLDANRFHASDSTECNQARNDLALTLQELSNNNLGPEEKRIVTQMADTTLKLVEANQPDLAQTFLDGLNATAEFVIGATGEFIKIRALQAGTSYILEFAASSPLIASTLPTLPYSPLIVPAVTIGYTAYHIGSNIKEMIDAADKAPTLWEQGQYKDLGALSTDVFFSATSFKSLHDLYKKHKALPTLTQGLKAGANAAKRIEHLEKHSQELYTKVKGTKFYTQTVKKAVKTGTSEQAIERRVEGLCRIHNSPEEVAVSFERLNNLQMRQSKAVLKGTGKNPKYDYDHICRLDTNIKKGKLIGISGFHIDHNNKIKNSGKIEYIGTEEGPSGIWRAIIRCEGKQKESSFFPPHMTEEEVFSLCDKLLENLDISKLKPKKDGKIIKNVPTDLGFFVTFSINPVSGEVYSIYPWIPEWKESLAKKTFSTGNK